MLLRALALQGVFTFAVVTVFLMAVVLYTRPGRRS